jgi:uncharacterized Zn finger protein
MRNKASVIQDFIGDDALLVLALPSNNNYGRSIYKRGGVELITFQSRHVEAWVGGLSGTSPEGGGQRRRVQFDVTAKGLEWHCAGNPKNHQIFCKHCVALALAINEQGNAQPSV